MDLELLEEIRSFTKKKRLVKELDSSQTTTLTNGVASSFVANSNKRWWWESLSCPNKTVDYGDEDGLEIIGRNLAGDSTVYLVVTDDEFAPWPVFSGPLDCVLEIISELRYFEYFLVSEDSSWCIFDTHHNSLVIVGDIQHNFC